MKSQSKLDFPGAVRLLGNDRVVATAADLARWLTCHSAGILRAADAGKIRRYGLRYYDAEDALKAAPGKGRPGRKPLHTEKEGM
ncbi:MAG: hypothetical protein IAE94_01810 [Chthoniobacterales bacterium]|nr:hypothetical protein [Chthoniobacterales bacterium]